jgi:hypothetical protein
MEGILWRNATASLTNWLKFVSVVVAAWTATKANTADTELKWGKIIWCYPSAWAADKHVNLVSLAPTTWVVTVTTNWNTTADITYTVVVSLASWDIA